MNPPGRTHLDDSIDASSDDPSGNPHEDGYTIGYDSPAATRIGGEDVDDLKVKRLREHNDGRHQSDGEHSVRESRRDKRRIPQAITSSLPLAPRERETVINTVENIDYSRFGHQKGIARVTLGVVAVIIDELKRQNASDTPEIVLWTDEFQDICRAHDVSMSDLSTIKEKVREAVIDGEVVKGPRRPQRDPLLPGPTPPDEYPDRYWAEQSPEYWIGMAKSWDRTPQGWKEAFPDEYQKLVNLLRQWEPWEDTPNEIPDELTEQTNASDHGESEKPAEEFVQEFLDGLDE
jgi:hypothetical protein